MTQSELKALAEGATPGEWQTYYYDGERFIFVTGRGAVCSFPYAGIADQAFIAAANPTAILALIAENEAQAATIEQMKHTLRFYAGSLNYSEIRAPDGDNGRSQVSRDCGQRARAALSIGEKV